MNRRTFLQAVAAAIIIGPRAWAESIETRVFAATGAKWYKVLIHSHCRDFSDGALSAAEVIRTAKRMGYAALIETDHYKSIGQSPEAFANYRRAFASQDGIIVIPGAEIVTVTAHILALGDIVYDEELLRLYGQSGVQQQVLDRLAELGLISVAAHPSLREAMNPRSPGDYVDMTFDWQNARGLCGVEMLNDKEFYSETVQHYVNAVLGGERWFVTAGCDQHGALNPALDERWQRATWVWVEGKFTKESLLEALRNGQTYAAEGVHLSFINLPPGQTPRRVKWLGLMIDPAFDRLPKKPWHLMIRRRGMTSDQEMPAGRQVNGCGIVEERDGIPVKNQVDYHHTNPEGHYRYVLELAGAGLITSPINLVLDYPD